MKRSFLKSHGRHPPGWDGLQVSSERVPIPRSVSVICLNGSTALAWESVSDAQRHQTAIVLRQPMGHGMFWST
jgi:hypothetical protein